jgi:hypothetical protein
VNRIKEEEEVYVAVPWFKTQEKMAEEEKELFFVSPLQKTKQPRDL